MRLFVKFEFHANFDSAHLSIFYMYLANPYETSLFLYHKASGSSLCRYQFVHKGFTLKTS